MTRLHTDAADAAADATLRLAATRCAPGPGPLGSTGCAEARSGPDPTGSEPTRRGEAAMSRPFTLTGRLQSFRHAFAGLGTMLRTQHNAWIHAVATLAVIAAGTLVGLAAAEWCWLVLAMMAVWTAEALNTAFELLADVASPDFHPLVKKAKDVAAAAVLLSALGAVVVGVLILGPHLWRLL